MNRLSLVSFAVIAVVCAPDARLAAAQNPPAESIAQESAAQVQTALPLHIDEPGVFQRTFTWVGDKMRDSSGEAKDGLYPRVGAMIPGAGGLSAGPGYRQHVFNGAAVVDVSAAISWRRYSTMQSRIEWPALFSDHLSIGAGVKYQDFTQINYFGVGPDSNKSAQADYRLKNIDIAGSATVRPTRWLSLGGSVGYIRGLAITAGLSTIHPPIHDVFDETTAPGLTVQPRYAHADVFLEADTRDTPGYPKSGGLYRLGLTTFHDRDGSGQSFRRVDADLTHYVPVLRRNWIVVVRGHVALSQTGAGNEVPFYLMPTLGGGNTLRGYGDYRFRDHDAASVGAEYRVPVFRRMDAALFADAGSVAPTASGLLRERPLHDYGFGVRFHTATSSVARIDVAKGQEGTRVSLSLTRSLGRSSRSVLPYVP